MNNNDAVVRIMQIRSSIQGLVDEARDIVEKFSPDYYDTYSAYVFEQIEEHLEKSNRYNTDFHDIASKLADKCELQ